MAPRTSSFLERPDPRPVLVSILGGSWVVLCGFGVLRAVIALAGLAGGVEFGTEDPRAELARVAPEYVEESWLVEQARERELRGLERQAGAPMAALSIGGIVGGVFLLQNRRRARTVLVGVGVGLVGLSAWHAIRLLEVTTRVDPGVVVPPEVGSMFWSVAAINVLLQSIPIVLGLGLLRHPAVREWVRASSPGPTGGRDRKERSPGEGIC